MINQPMLPDFEGTAVSKSSVRITKAGDGLSEALDLEPKAMHAGDEAFYVIKVTFTGVNHKSDKKTGTLVRVHTAEVEDIVEIDAATASQMIDEERAELRRRQRAAAAAQGREELPLDGELEADPPAGELEVDGDSATGPTDPWEYDAPGGVPVDGEEDEDSEDSEPDQPVSGNSEPQVSGKTEPSDSSTSSEEPVSGKTEPDPPADQVPAKRAARKAPAKKAAKKTAPRGEK